MRQTSPFWHLHLAFSREGKIGVISRTSNFFHLSRLLVFKETFQGLSRVVTTLRHWAVLQLAWEPTWVDNFCLRSFRKAACYHQLVMPLLCTITQLRSCVERWTFLSVVLETKSIKFITLTWKHNRYPIDFPFQMSFLNRWKWFFYSGPKSFVRRNQQKLVCRTPIRRFRYHQPQRYLLGYQSSSAFRGLIGACFQNFVTATWLCNIFDEQTNSSTK